MQQSMVYRYGLLPPTVNGDKIAEQMYLAHKYQNTLIELERKRRANVRAILVSHGSVEQLVATIEERQRKLTELRNLIKQRKQTAHLTRVPTDRETNAATKKEADALKLELRTLRAQLKEDKLKLKEDPEIQALIKAENDVSHEASILARKNCGVYWGTYLQIEAAVDAAKRGKMDPKFQRWTGDGAIAVQIQHGLDRMGLCSDDQRIQIDMKRQPIPGRQGKPRPRIRIRIGSTEQRDPIWGEWPMIYHRPLPEGTIVKWIKVVRRRTAGADTWSVHLTVETPLVAGPVVKESTAVAVDLGWRKDGPEDALRAGGWIDHEGNGGDIMVHQAIRGALRKVEDLRSIRDKNLNAQKALMLDWHKTANLDAEHMDRLAWMAQWRSPARFAALALWWRDHRIDGDEDFFNALEAWRKKDKHLWQWEANQRRKSLLRRREDYRVLAARFAKTYGTLVLERLNLADMARIPEPESSNRSHPQARSQRFETAPSELRQALILAFKKNCRRIFTVKAAGPAVLLYSAWKEGKDVEEMTAPKEATTKGSRFKKAATATSAVTAT